MANSVEEITGTGPVVVWLKSSLRTHENPAIDAGRILADRYNLPLLVYQGIDERYPHANARHHSIDSFIITITRSWQHMVDVSGQTIRFLRC